MPQSSLCDGAQRPKKLLDQLRDRIRLKSYSYRTEESYVSWVKRFILFHNKRHPRAMGREPPGREIEAFLTHLVLERRIAPSTQNQALHAIIFLYRKMLDQPIAERINALRAQGRRRLLAGLWGDRLRVRNANFVFRRRFDPATARRDKVQLP